MDDRVKSIISLVEGDINPIAVTTVKFDNFQSPVAVLDRYCTNPDCDCRNTTLGFFEIVDNKIEDELFNIQINVDSWETISYQVIRKDIDCDDMYREFIRDIDDKTRLIIKKRFEDGKRFGGELLKENIDYDAIRRNEAICYAEVFNSKDYDRFFFKYNGIDFAVLDSYCTNPKCHCNDVTLIFYEMDPSRETSSFFFALQSKFKRGKYKVVNKLDRVNSREIKDLYNYFMEHLNDPGFELLKKRYARMKNLSAALGLNEAASVNRPINLSDNLNNIKVGRNEPCPCGSGKKYKKCCKNQ